MDEITRFSLEGDNNPANQRVCRHGKPIGEDCGSCDLAPTPASPHQHELGLMAEHAAKIERARIRQMALDLAEKWETAEGDDVPNTKSDLDWKAEALRDFAGLLEER